MPDCSVCGSQDFTNIDGFFYCTLCQTQSQDIRAEEREDEAFISLSRGSQIKTAKPKIVKRKVDLGRPWETCEAFQHIIKQQIKFLIKKGADPKLKDVVFKLWSQYLCKARTAFCEPGVEKPLKELTTRDAYVCTLEDPVVKPVRKWQTCYRQERFDRLPASFRDRHNAKVHAGIDALTRESGEKPATTETENEEFYAGDDPHEAEDEQGISTQLDLIVQYGGDTSSDSDSTSIEDDWSDSDGGEDGDNRQQGVGKKKSDSTESEETDREEMDDFDRRKSLKKYYSPYRRMEQLCMRWTVCLCYLGLLYTQSNIMPSHLIRWMENGEFPYRNAGNLLPDDFKLCREDVLVFNHVTIPKHIQLRTDAGRLAKFMGTTNFIQPQVKVLISAYILELDLPNEFHGLVTSLLNQIKLLPDFQFSTDSHIAIPDYEGIAATILVILLKMLFRLDGKSEGKISEHAKELEHVLPMDLSLFTWTAWMEHMMWREHKATKVSLPTTPQEAEAMRDMSAALQQFKQITINPRKVFKQNRLYGGKEKLWKRPESREALYKPFQQLSAHLASSTQHNVSPTGQDTPSTSYHTDPYMSTAQSADQQTPEASGPSPITGLQIDTPTLLDDPVEEWLNYGDSSSQSTCGNKLKHSTETKGNPFSTHTVSYLIDDDFIDRLTAEDSQYLFSGSSQGSRQEEEEGQGQGYETHSDSDLDPSQDLFVTPKKRKQNLKPAAVRTLFNKARTSKARSKEMIEKAKEMVEDFSVKPFQNYLIYRDFSDVPGNYGWLIKTLAQHIQTQAQELHELVKIFETILFIRDLGKLTPFERRQLRMQRTKYFGAGTLQGSTGW